MTLRGTRTTIELQYATIKHQVTPGSVGPATIERIERIDVSRSTAIKACITSVIQTPTGWKFEIITCWNNYLSNSATHASQSCEKNVYISPPRIERIERIERSLRLRVDVNSCESYIVNTDKSCMRERLYANSQTNKQTNKQTHMQSYKHRQTHKCIHTTNMHL